MKEKKLSQMQNQNWAIKMTKNKSKKRMIIDEALKDLGIEPVPPDHPIYRIGPSIRFISKKKIKIDDWFWCM